MTNKTLLALAAATVFASTGAVAADGHDTHGPAFVPVQYHDGDKWDDRSASVNDRESRLNDRIQRGIRDGRISEREARSLQRELSQIESKERGYNHDGRLDGRESQEINRDLDRLTDHVRQQIRD